MHFSIGELSLKISPIMSFTRGGSMSLLILTSID